MFKSEIYIPLILNEHDVVLNIYGNNNISEIGIDEAADNGEARYQLREGEFYEYKISDGYRLQCPEIINQSKIKGQEASGVISPNIYVGTLDIDILDNQGKKCRTIKLEVQSKKAKYREDYRYMLEEITEKCHDLILQHNSPVSQFFEPDYFKDPTTIYQRFAFIKSVLDSLEFSDAVHKVISSPVTKWKESETEKDIRNARRMNSSSIRQLCNATNRINLPSNHSLKSTVKSVPLKIKIAYKTETVDTPENRFIKYALNYFLSFVGDFRIKLKDGSRTKEEATLIEDKLELFLSHSLFKEISSPTTLPFNSPVLQRKEGYREILRVWLMFDLAAKLIWHGGDDVYSGGKKDVATLYEYWLFFKLLEIIKDVFKIEPKSLKDLIKQTDDGLGLQLKQGKHFPVEGVFETLTRKLNLLFSYNRSFAGSKTYPNAGSWTKNMRPDYTLSIWPYSISQNEAEAEELIVHIHFDAKYKVEKLSEIFGEVKVIEPSEDEIQSELSSEKEEQKKGTFKRADLLKMHSYKDAIRRTAGAYVLYPGNDKPYNPIGFHEIIPGLGAFSIRPSKTNSGTEELKNFLNEVVLHFLNRASQREKMSLKTYETYKDDNSNEVNESLPETLGKNRSLLPDETYILVAYYKDKQHLKWILNNKLYNARTGSSRGSLRLSPKETGAKYLLLHGLGEIKTAKLFRLHDSGPRIFSKQDMISKDYDNPGQEFYLVYEIQDQAESEFRNILWDINRLHDLKRGRGSAIPFSVSMTELMNSKINT